jgi:hypothetical protein
MQKKASMFFSDSVVPEKPAPNLIPLCRVNLSHYKTPGIFLL